MFVCLNVCLFVFGACFFYNCAFFSDHPLQASPAELFKEAAIAAVTTCAAERVASYGRFNLKMNSAACELVQRSKIIDSQAQIMKEELRRKEAENNKLNTKISQMEANRQIVEEELRRKEAENNTLKTKISQMEAEAVEALKKEKTFGTIIKFLEKKNDETTHEANLQKKKITKKNREKRHLTTELNFTNRRIEVAQKTGGVRDEIIERTSFNLTFAENKIEQKSQLLEILETQTADLTTSLALGEQRETILVEESKKIESELKAVKSEKNVLEQESKRKITQLKRDGLAKGGRIGSLKDRLSVEERKGKSNALISADQIDKLVLEKAEMSNLIEKGRKAGRWLIHEVRVKNQQLNAFTSERAKMTELIERGGNGGRWLGRQVRMKNREINTMERALSNKQASIESTEFLLREKGEEVEILRTASNASSNLARMAWFNTNGRAGVNPAQSRLLQALDQKVSNLQRGNLHLMENLNAAEMALGLRTQVPNNSRYPYNYMG